MTLENKIKIVNRIKHHIHKDNNGYCGIFWATKNIMGNDYNPKAYETDSIASIITESGKYKKERADRESVYDYHITLNSESDWFKRNPVKTEIIRFLVTVSTAVIISYIAQYN